MCTITSMGNSAPDFAGLLESWIVTLRATGKAANTRMVYEDSVRMLLQSSGGEFDRQAVINFMGEMQDRGAESATIRLRLAAIKQFARWLSDEGYLDKPHLIANIPTPKLNQRPVPALDSTEIKAILKQCAGDELRDLRDRAALTLLTETGMRASELLALNISDLSLVKCTALVRGSKNGTYRKVKFSPKCAMVLDKYVRTLTAIKGPENLWTSKFGKLTYGGLSASLKGRAKAAGVHGFHIHRLRHTAAVRWMQQGGSETGLMTQAGWKSRTMIERYVKTSAEDLAAAEFDRLDLSL